jgi:hypothetical protein
VAKGPSKKEGLAPSLVEGYYCKDCRRLDGGGTGAQRGYTQRTSGSFASRKQQGVSREGKEESRWHRLKLWTPAGPSIVPPRMFLVQLLAFLA